MRSKQDLEMSAPLMRSAIKQINDKFPLPLENKYILSFEFEDLSKKRHRHHERL